MEKKTFFIGLGILLAAGAAVGVGIHLHNKNKKEEEGSTAQPSGPSKLVDVNGNPIQSASGTMKSMVTPKMAGARIKNILAAKKANEGKVGFIDVEPVLLTPDRGWSNFTKASKTAVCWGAPPSGNGDLVKVPCAGHHGSI